MNWSQMEYQLEQLRERINWCETYPTFDNFVWTRLFLKDMINATAENRRVEHEAIEKQFVHELEEAVHEAIPTGV